VTEDDAKKLLWDLFAHVGVETLGRGDDPRRWSSTDFGTDAAGYLAERVTAIVAAERERCKQCVAAPACWTTDAVDAVRKEFIERIESGKTIVELGYGEKP
jgi:hypothetical protein